MHDFAQSGPICTLHRLNDTHDTKLEQELTRHAQERPVSLIIPCHGRDLTQPPLEHIFAELAPVRWLREIVVSVNGASAAELDHVTRLALACPYPVRVLGQDALHHLDASTGGKGANVEAAVRLIHEEGQSAYLAVQDADVASFGRGNLARLVAACVDPRLGFRFGKMYYARVTDRMYGRVTRLFFAPLLAALRKQLGDHPLLEFYSAFRYPLAGECACAVPLAAQLTYVPGWGLETKMLAEVWHHTMPGEVCQVDGGTGYHHRHHPVRGKTGLSEMCRVVAHTLFAELEAAAAGSGEALAEAAREGYEEEAEQHRRFSAAVAHLNGLPQDDLADGEMIREFARVLRQLNHAALAATTP